jgi:peroxiredoxin
VSCRVELVQLDRERAEFDRRGVGIAGVSFDPPADLREFRAKEKLSIGLLSDESEALAKTLGIVHLNVVPGKDAYYPTKVLIDASGKVLWAFAEDDLRVREGPAAVLAAIDGVLR